jgi:hypothetical protein
MKEVTNQSGEITIETTKEERYNFLKRELTTKISKSLGLSLLLTVTSHISVKNLVRQAIFAKFEKIDMYSCKPEVLALFSAWRGIYDSISDSISIILERNSDNFIVPVAQLLFDNGGVLRYVSPYTYCDNEDFKGVVYPEKTEALLNSLVHLDDFNADVVYPTIFLYGPPGTGKTEFGKALASRTGLEHKCFTPDSLTGPKNFWEDNRGTEIIIINEFDKIEFKESLPSVLEMLDSKPPEYFVIITSNKPPKDFPSPLMRAGRIGINLEVGFMSYDEIKRLFDLRFGDLSDKAMKAYMKKNKLTKASKFQPAAVAYSYLHVLQSMITTCASNNEELPEEETRQITLLEHIKSAGGTKKNPKLSLIKSLLFKKNV